MHRAPTNMIAVNNKRTEVPPGFFLKTTAKALSLFICDHIVLIGESYTNTILHRDTVDRDTMDNNEALL